MKCPNCGSDSPEGALECSCGLIFSKWRKKAEAPAAPAPDPAAPDDTTAPPAEPAARGMLYYLVIAALLCAASLAAVHKFYRPAPVRNGPKLLSPEKFRAEITALEAALYKDEPANYTDAAAIGEQAGRISRQLIGASSPVQRDRALKLAALEAALGGEGLSYAVTARRDWMAQWEQAREGMFEKADWMREARVVSAAASSAANPQQVKLSMQQALSMMELLIVQAAAETQAFGKDEINLGNMRVIPDSQARLENWRSWVGLWQARVAQASAIMPDPRNIADSDLKEVHRAMTQVLGLLADPPDPGAGVFLDIADPAFKARYQPSQYYREDWLKTAKNWLVFPRSVLTGKPQAGEGGGT